MGDALKIKMGVDASGVKKGTQEAKQNLKEFSDSGKKAINSIGDAIGVNTGKIEQMGRIFSGAATKMGREAGLAAGEVSKISSAMGIVGIGAGVVAATVVGAWKQMSSAAEHYFNTVEGGGKGAGLKGYTDTLKAAASDVFATEQNADTYIGIKKWFANVWQTIKNTGAHYLTGDTSFKGASPIVGAFVGATQDVSVATVQAKKAEEISQKLYENREKEINASVELAQLNATIAENMRIMRDSEEDISARKEARIAAEEAIEKRYQIQNELYSEKLTLLQTYHSLSKSSLDDIKEEKDIEIAIANASKERADNMRTIDRAAKSINKELNKNKGPKGVITVGGPIDWLPTIDDSVLKDKLPQQLQEKILEMPKMQFEVPMTVDPDVAISESDWQNAFADLFSDIASSIGNLLGDAITGQADFSNFGASILQGIGGFAAKLGSLLIAFGTAKLAFDNAWTAGPAGAIAAIGIGATLVALGSAINTVGSNMSGSSYSSGYTYASGYNNTNYANDYATSSMTVNVTGTLVASGSELIAVINNENNRKNHTT